MSQRTRAIETVVLARLRAMLDPLMSSIDDLDADIRRPKPKILFTIGPVTEVAVATPVTAHARSSAAHHRRDRVANNTLQMTDIQQSALSLTIVDARGNPASLPEGDVPAWSVTDTTILTLTVGADGMTASVAAAGPLGNATVNVSAALADGSQAAGGLDVTVVSSAASAIAVVAGAPTP